jgi:hypothetical protein
MEATATTAPILERVRLRWAVSNLSRYYGRDKYIGNVESICADRLGWMNLPLTPALDPAPADALHLSGDRSELACVAICCPMWEQLRKFARFVVYWEQG